MDADAEPQKKRVLTKSHFVGGGIVAALIAIQPVTKMFMPRETIEAKISAVESTMTSNHREILDRLDRLERAMRDRDMAIESRHNRELDLLTNRIETLEAARMGVQKNKNN